MKNIKIILSSFVGRIIFQFIFLLNKVVIHGEKHLLDLIKEDKPIMVCVWHGRLLFPSWYIRLKTTNLFAIASHHSDAEIMARILKKWGYSLIRGSTKKGGKAVVVKMAEVFKNKGIVAVTNDGPKGPPMVAKRGSAILALKNNAQIIAITAEASKYWKLPSWDKTIIPKPFSTIYIQFSKPLDNNNISGNEVQVISDYITKNYHGLQNNIKK